MPHLGPTELIIILVIVVLLFGASRLPELARSIGVSMKEFKKAANESKEDDKETKQA
jgi:sec-independent protein translocase protein TatA